MQMRMHQHLASFIHTTTSLRRVGPKPLTCLCSKLRTITTSEAPTPRAAVSVVVRGCNGEDEDKFLLVQRGKAPNKGVWSFAGGKLEYGETTLQGGQRELQEETLWDSDDWSKLRWFSDPICTSDSIGEGYHYLIAQCYAEIVVDGNYPILEAADDAVAVEWFTKDEIRVLENDGHVVTGIDRVLVRLQELLVHKLLPTETI